MIWKPWMTICVLLALFASGQNGSAAEQIAYHGYSKAIEIRNDTVRVVLCPEVGGRILEYSLDGTNVLYLSEQEKNWKPGSKPTESAGRFDFGPEYTVPRRSILKVGEWTSEVMGERSVRLTSQKDLSSGVQLVRDFELASDSTHLSCKQTIINVSKSVKEYCHWSRTFAVGKGICVVPLTPEDSVPKSRFPNSYVMYDGGIRVRVDDPNIRHRDGVLEIHATPRQPKLGFDSYVGELAYAAPNNLLFLKRFKTYPDRVYNEVAGLTISVWYPDGPMVELEPIGPRERIEPGDSASFTEHWWLAPLQFPQNGKLNHNKLRALIDTLK